MKQTWMKLLAGTTFAGALLIGGHASAGYNDLIKALEAKGTLSAEEAKELKIAEVVPDNSDAKKLEVTGRLHFQFGYVDQENDVNSGDWSTFEVRRARIGVKGKLGNDISAGVEANVKPGDVSISAATMTWGPSDAFELTAGFDKPMVSLEENTSSASILTVERSNVNNNIAAGYDSTGVWASGEVAPFFYHVGVYNGEDLDSSRNTSNEEAEYAFNARGGIALDLSEGSTVKAMVSYLQSDDPNGAMSYEDITVASLHFKAGMFDLRTEYFMGSDEGEDTTGFYVMPSVKLSKQLEAVARFEMAESDKATGIRAQSRYARRTDVVVIDEDTTADRGDEFSAIYLGMNYYFQKYNKVMFGVEFSELDNTVAGKLDSTSVFGAYRIRF